MLTSSCNVYYKIFLVLLCIDNFTFTLSSSSSSSSFWVLCVEWKLHMLRRSLMQQTNKRQKILEPIRGSHRSHTHTTDVRNVTVYSWVKIVSWKVKGEDVFASFLPGVKGNEHGWTNGWSHRWWCIRNNISIFFSFIISEWTNQPTNQLPVPNFHLLAAAQQPENWVDSSGCPS